MNPIEIYEAVLNGRISRFPRDFFSGEGINCNTSVCVPIIKYLIEDKLNWNEEDIKENLTRNVFREYKLGGMLTHIFDDSPYLALNFAYPNKYNPWELKRDNEKLLDKETWNRGYKMANR